MIPIIVPAAIHQHTTRPPPAAASEPRNRPAMPESHKHQQERSITNRSGQQHPGGIAAGGHATPGGQPGADHAKGRTLNRKPTAKNPEDAVEMIIEANRELTRLEIGSDAIREELLVAA